MFQLNKHERVHADEVTSAKYSNKSTDNASKKATIVTCASNSTLNTIKSTTSRTCANKNTTSVTSATKNSATEDRNISSVTKNTTTANELTKNMAYAENTTRTTNATKNTDNSNENTAATEYNSNATTPLGTQGKEIHETEQSGGVKDQINLQQIMRSRIKNIIFGMVSTCCKLLSLNTDALVYSKKCYEWFNAVVLNCFQMAECGTLFIRRKICATLFLHYKL